MTRWVLLWSLFAVGAMAAHDGIGTCLFTLLALCVWSDK